MSETTATDTLHCRRCGTEFSSPMIYTPDPEEVIAYCSWECADV